MLIYPSVLTILIISCIFIYALSGIKYHVKFYTRLYSILLKSRLCHKDAMIYLVIIYLKGDPEWKCHYMKGRLNQYFQSFDQFILDITLFHYNIHPWQQNWHTDILNKKIFIDNKINNVRKYLRIYKKKYSIKGFTKSTEHHSVYNNLSFEIKKDLIRLKEKMYGVEINSDNSCLNKNLDILKEELNFIDGIVQKQKIINQFI